MKSLQSTVKRVAFFNNKGGCGKTTFAVHTAFVAEEWKIKTILACLDRQGNSLVWISKGDRAAKADAFYEKSDYLSAVFSPLVMPDIENIDLVLADCPPEIEIALTVNPTLWVVPVHGRQGFDGFTNVVDDLIASKAEVLVVRNTVRFPCEIDAKLQDLVEYHEGTMVWVISMLVQNEWVRTRRALRERQPTAGDEVSEAAGKAGPDPAEIQAEKPETPP